MPQRESKVISKRPKSDHVYFQGGIDHLQDPTISNEELLLDDIFHFQGGIIIDHSQNQTISLNSNDLIQYFKHKEISSNVYEGISNGRKVCAKIDGASKIDKEIKLLRSLDHKNILRLFFGSLLSDGKKILVTEFYGTPLNNFTCKAIEKPIMHQLTNAVNYLRVS